LLSLAKNGKTSPRNLLKLISNSTTRMYISFATIPLAILLFYGIEDKTAWFFEGRHIGSYHYIVDNKHFYPIGLMVPHYAMIATVSIVGILISWLIHQMWELSNISIARALRRRKHNNLPISPHSLQTESPSLRSPWCIKSLRV
jgi:uncharacterized membrane protein YciS (DUF1049 family)